MRYAPPQKKSITYEFRKNLIASAVTFAFSTLTVCAATGDVIDKIFLENDGDNGDFTEYRTDIIESGVYDSINLPDFNPPSSKDQFAVRVLNGAEWNLAVFGTGAINGWDKVKITHWDNSITAL